MSKKAWIIFSAVCIALLGVLVWVSSKDKVDVSSADANKQQVASVQSGDIGDHVFGKADSKVMLVEYGDFQCPGCGGAYPVIKEVTEKYKNQIAFVFRNFPLTSIHPNARVAAASAEAAGLQGKYWEMHDKLYENQASWQNLTPNDRTNFFAEYAKDLGLDVERFKVDLAGEAVNKKIGFDIAVGKKIGVNATPTFVLNGTKGPDMFNPQGGVDQDKLIAVLKAEMIKNGIKVPKD